MKKNSFSSGINLTQLISTVALTFAIRKNPGAIFVSSPAVRDAAA